MGRIGSTIPKPIRSIRTVRKMTPRRERSGTTRQLPLDAGERGAGALVAGIELETAAQRRRGRAEIPEQHLRAGEVEVRRGEARVARERLANQRHRLGGAPPRQPPPAGVEG